MAGAAISGEATRTIGRPVAGLMSTSAVTPYTDRKSSRVDHVLWRADGNDPAIGHDDQSVADRRGQREIVQHGEHRRIASVREFADEAMDLDDMSDVEVRGGLVEEQDRRILRQRLRQDHPTTLSAGELRHRSIGQMLHAHRSQRLTCLGPILIGAGPPPRDVGRPPHQHELQHGERERGDHVLRHDGNEPRRLSTCERERIEPGDAYVAGARAQRP